VPDLEAETELKETCMYHASQNGHFHVVEYLLELEAGRGLTMVGSSHRLIHNGLSLSSVSARPTGR
jgi:hypothetical protein